MNYYYVGPTVHGIDKSEHSHILAHIIFSAIPLFIYFKHFLSIFVLLISVLNIYLFTYHAFVFSNSHLCFCAICFSNKLTN